MRLVNVVLLLFSAWPVGELVFARFRTANRADAEARDRGSFGVLWALIGVSILLGFLLQTVPGPRIPMPLERRALVALALLAAGLLLRIVSIVKLGRFFTVNVAVHEGQTVVQSGPYRWTRHPSYAGALIALLGIAILPGSWLSFAVVVIPITCAFLYRIHVEERALTEHLGESYRAYSRTTSRLIPWIY